MDWISTNWHTLVTPLLWTLLGVVVGWGIASHYYRKSSQDLKREADRLSKLSEQLSAQVKEHREHSDRLGEIIDTLASSMEASGMVHLNRDQNGRLITIRRVTANIKTDDTKGSASLNVGQH